MNVETPKRNVCADCGRTVWLRTAGTVGIGPAPAGTVIWQWAARRGSKPAPLRCPVANRIGHRVDGQPHRFYGDPDDPIATMD